MCGSHAAAISFQWLKVRRHYENAAVCEVNFLTRVLGLSNSRSGRMPCSENKNRVRNGGS